MQSHSIYLLIFHGSSDRRPLEAAKALANFFAHRIQHASSRTLISSSAGTWGAESFTNASIQFTNGSDRPPASLTSVFAPPVVEVAALEGADEPLHQQIIRVAKTLDPSTNKVISQPIQIMLLPLFLLRGVHVMEDIPAEVGLAQQTLGAKFEIKIAPHIGSHPGLERLITERISAQPVEAWILLAHGSRRPGANEAVEALAERLGAITAYWSVPPDLETRLRELAALKLRKIAILPYFLFSGMITDAIAQRLTNLSHQFPTLDLHLTAPLAASPELADLLLELATQG